MSAPRKSREEEQFEAEMDKAEEIASDRREREVDPYDQDRRQDAYERQFGW